MRQPVDTIRHDVLHGARNADLIDPQPGRYAPFSPTRTPASTRERTLSSAKNGFPSVRRINSSLSGAEICVASQQVLQEFLRAGRLQRVDAKLRVIGFIAPAMTVLGPVIDQQKNTCQRETFYEAIEKCLRFAVDPMQVLKNE